MTEAIDLTGARRHAEIEGHPDPGLGVSERVELIVKYGYLVTAATITLKLLQKAADSES